MAMHNTVDSQSLGRIGVLAGGPSNERAISLQSGKAVFNALKKVNADAVFLNIKRELTIDEVRGFNIDVAFIALHGRFGEDGTIQSILEKAHIPYTGSGPMASRIALDKIASREIFMRQGLDVPSYKVLDKRKLIECTDLKKITQVIGLPLVVKPQLEGSSIGISVVKDNKGLKKAVDTAFDYGERIIVEEYIKGRELTVGILENEPLPVIEIIVKERFYNFNAKYKRADTQYIVPAKIAPKVYRIAQLKGRMAHMSLRCETFSRVDMIFDEEKGKLFILEVNSIPGFTSHSLLPKAAACAGIRFSELCLRIIKSALDNKREVDIIGKAFKEV
jgi:D-alanine-D-alanine ligase